MATYTLKMDTCEAKPKMEISFGEVPENKIKRALDFASGAFRQIEVINEETGEVMFSRYESASWFTPVYSYGEAIDIISNICYVDDF